MTEKKERLFELCLSYLADLNGSEWIKGDGPGEKDMRQRAKSLQEMMCKEVYGK